MTSVSAGLLSLYYIAMLLMVPASVWVSQRSIPTRSRTSNEEVITPPGNLFILDWVNHESAGNPGSLRDHLSEGVVINGGGTVYYH